MELVSLAVSQDVIYSENFDALEDILMPAADENIPDNILGWTHEPPPGWGIASFGAGFAGCKSRRHLLGEL